MTTANAAERSGASREGMLARHPLFFYFLFAFAFSWLMFLPGPLTYFGVLNVNPQILGMMGIIGLLGPILSGFVMTAVVEGGVGIRRWLRLIVMWRVGLGLGLTRLRGSSWLSVKRCGKLPAEKTRQMIEVAHVRLPHRAARSRAA